MSYSYLLPLKYAIVMAEKQDIAMNQFPTWSSMDYVYVERGDSQGKVHKSNILSAIILGNKSEPYDCNEIKSGCIICSSKWTNAPVNTIAILETIIYSEDWLIQRFSVPGSTLRLFIRSFYNGSTWSDWKSVTLT